MSLKFEKRGRKWRLIYIQKEVGSLDNAIQNEEIKNWAVEAMVKFYDVFKESGEMENAVREAKRG